MYYEIYIDSLLLVNLVMNLYCLELVNLFFLRSATRRRIFLAAALGAALYLVPFCLSGPARIKMLIFFPISVAVMILTAFPIRQIGAFWHAVGILFIVSFAFGGGIYIVIRSFPALFGFWGEMFTIMGIGALIFMEMSHLILRRKSCELCKVELIGMGSKVKVTGLIDSGNGLVEPISGQPVCVLDKRLFDSLWRTGKPGGFRVIPYHSVGKKSGILYGYLIPEIKIEWNGMMRSCKNIYVGVSKEAVAKEGGYGMIVPPELFS